MHPRDALAVITRKFRKPVQFALDPADAAQIAATAHGRLAEIFFANTGRPVHKWVHYLDAYDRHFGSFTAPKMLEIGVYRGGSLKLWRDYFGPDATIFGIDIDPQCAAFGGGNGVVRIGSQADPDFLRDVVREMGGVDIVLDDGSHIASHQRATFTTLFPLLNEGGIYAIEDLHTSYWPGLFEGGYHRRGTGIELVKQLIDDQNGAYHRRSARFADGDLIAGIHSYDSIAFIEKKRMALRGDVEIGEGAFDWRSYWAEHSLPPLAPKSLLARLHRRR